MISDDIEILYEDKDVLVVNKPSGLLVHGDGKNKEETLCDWILKNYPKIGNVGESQKLNSGEVIKRPGIVHRLDKDTSGVILIAKNQVSFLDLKEQFQKRKIQKKYGVFVYGEMKGREGIINRPIGRSRKDFRMWSAQRGAKGELRDAITEYKILNTAKLDTLEGVSYLEVSPKTGRTHQIRVHLKSINHPVVADKLYAPKRDPVLGFKRLALHAFSIEFKNLKGEKTKIESELPEDFEKALKKLL